MIKPVFQHSVVTDTGDVVPSADIQIRDEVTGLYPTGKIYTDRDGLNPIAEDTLAADSEGFFRFYADPGIYKITAIGVSGSRIWRDVILVSQESILSLAGGAAGQVLKKISGDDYDYAWDKAGAGATGGGDDEVFVENDQVVTTSYTITSGKNAMSTGEVSINSGVTVTVPTGSRWVIL